MTRVAVASIAARMTARRARRRAVDQDDDPSAAAEEFDRYMERRRAWSAAPVDLRSAVALALVRRSVALARHRRRIVVATTTAVAAAPTIAATTAGPWPVLWVVYAAAMAVALGSCALGRFAPYRPADQLFDRGSWIGPVSPNLLRKMLAAETETFQHPAELVPLPEAAAPLADALVELDDLGELPGALAATEPWRSLTEPYLDAVAPGLAPAAHALAATSRYAQRPLREAAAVARRTYARQTA